MSESVQDISSISQITSYTKLDNKDFSFVDTYGNMIVNKSYQHGYEQFAKGKNTQEAFIYKALSAIGNDIEDTLYLNIRKYIDFVSNVDICKVKSLRSMLYIFGFKYSIFDNLNDIPVEILNLIDVLSINRKYLLKNGILRKEFLQVLSSDDNHVLFNVDDENYKIDFREFFTKNAYYISADSNVFDSKNVNVTKLKNLFKQIESISVRNDIISNCISNDLSVYIKDDIQSYISGDLSSLASCDLTDCISSNLSSYLSLQYKNDYSYKIIDDQFNKGFYIFNQSNDKVIGLDQDKIHSNLKSQNSFLEYDISDLVSSDQEFISANIDKRMKLFFKNLNYNEDLECIDDERYEEYIQGLFENLIYGYLTLTYNAQFVQNSRLEKVYVYPYLGNMYYENAITSDINIYQRLDEDDGTLEIKMFNHIPKSFNQKKIIDQIEEGNDSLQNYSGAELCVLNIEMQNRAKPLDLAKVGITNNSSKLLQTRYSYYREKDVAKYAKFIDNYYNSIVNNPKIYDFDSNYYVVDKSSDGPNVLSVLDPANINPQMDINYSMIKTVANYLAQLTLYICKIREKIKLQTQKNYMKGTNLLLIYIVNEYLNEYAKHNKSFFMDGNDKYMLSIYNNLANHQFGDEDGNYNVIVDEYYDETEYFNISTDTTLSSCINQANVNERYWEKTDNLKMTEMMKYDGKQLILAEIEKFYLSAFNLKNLVDDIRDDQYSGLQNFLSTLYDLGANDSFYFKLKDHNQISDIFPSVNNDMEKVLSSLEDFGISNDFLNSFSKQDSLSVFSSILDDPGVFATQIGQKIYSSDIYGRFIRLSTSFDVFNSYIDGGYVYPADTVKKQISDVRDNHVINKLSDHYMQNISVIYDKNMPAVEKISSDIGKLSNDYVQFINGTYSFYYKKSENKFCYEDREVGIGQYLPVHYYTGNETWTNDDMNLYQHLTSLQKYSTEEIIKNWSLIYTVNYISSNFDSIWNGCSDYIGILEINRQLTTKYKFIEPYFDTLDNEIQNTYDFLNNLVQDRKTMLYNQLQQLQNQASNLKTQYDTLNNTFTQAIANFNDNYEGYKLGDNVVHCVTWQKVRGAELGYTKFCHRDTAPHTGYTFNIFAHEVKYNGRDGVFYFDDKDNGGDFGYEDVEIDPIYDPEKPLEDQCNAVRAYINTTTSKDWHADKSAYTEYKGLRDEGMVAVLDSIKNGLEDIKASFENICTLAEELFGLDTNFSSVDLYQKINDLMVLLTSVDEKNINEDSVIGEYQQYLTKVIDLSARYQPVIAAFKNMFQDPEQKPYFEDFTYQMTELTRDNLKIIVNFYTKKDKENFQKIKEKVNAFIDVDFQSILDQQLGLIDSINQDILDDDTLITIIAQIACSNANDAENNLLRIYNKLVEIVNYKTKIAKLQIEFHLKIVNDCIGNMIAEIGEASLNSYSRLNDLVEQQISNLNFFIKDIYVKYNQMYLTYGGNDFCYDPYYNLKNTVHPSYQIHPFLWNMTKKIEGWCLIERGFKAGENLQDLNTIQLIGKYGQTIDTWKNANNNIVDFSGYVTRYEKSPNISEAGTLVNEVVDYDGGFYPPAASDFLLNSNACISSVFYQKKKNSVIEKEISPILSSDVSSYIRYNPSRGVVENDIYSTISGIVESYFISNDIEKNIFEYTNDIELQLSSITKLDILNVIQDSLPQTFFERYYDHLDLPSSQLKYIAAQLDEYQDQIKDIVSPKPVKDIYDIYKYGIDIFKNSYILYKRYQYNSKDSVDDITYQQKKNTLGRLWIRLSNHPIAFPAFSGIHPAYYIEDANLLNACIKELALLSDDGITYKDKYKKHIASINSQMEYFYDFELTQNKQNIILMVFNWKLGIKDKFFNRFDLAIVLPQVVQKHYDKKNDLEYLLFKNNASQDNSAIDYVDFDPKDGYISTYRNKYYINPSTLKDGVRYPALVGYYVYDYSVIDLVYVYKKFTSYEEDNQIKYKVQTSNCNENDKEYGSEKLKFPEYDEIKNFFIVKISNGINFKVTPSSLGKSINDFISKHKKTVGDDVCIAYDKNRNFMTMAFISKLDIPLSNIMGTETSLSDIDFDANTEGGLINDPLQFEMNSHDVLNQNVSLIDFKLKSSDVEHVDYNEYNINADISYIPQYPYLSGESRLYGKYSYDMYSIELLGKSHDIDGYIRIVNPDPDPYFDYQEIMESSIFGRVYEDFIDSADNSFYQFQNPALNDNMPYYSEMSPFIAYDDTANSQYCLDYVLQNFNPNKKFNEHDINTIQLIISNKDTLGKNPYYVGKLIDLTTQIELNYNSDDVKNQLEQKISSELQYGMSPTVVGTPGITQLFTSKDSNYLLGITKILAFFDKSQRILHLKFAYDKELPHERTFVPSGVINTIFLNDKDLTIFKYYHMLDSYGAINCKYIDTVDYENHNLSMDGWGFYYHNDLIDKTQMSSLLQSYYYNKSGAKEYLKDIELSAYDCLSDVYVLQGNKRLGFKYDEELRFDISSDLYYYPTLNISYPKAVGMYILKNQPNVINSTSIVQMSSIFSDDSTFIIGLDDPSKILDLIGEVDIPLIYNDVNDVRAYEDYLSNDISGVDNYKKFDITDPRAYEFVHFASILSDNVELSDHNIDVDATVVPEEFYKNKTIDQFLESCYNSFDGSQPLKSEELTSDVTSEYITVNVTSSNCNIDNYLKLFVGYKRNRDENDKLELYFNYSNYLNSPYVKIENDTEVKIDTIPGTYLKLKDGENGFLDIILQFRYYVGDIIYGYRNVKVLGYHIFNISDDKPKFLIYKSYQIQKNSLKLESKKTQVNVTIIANDINLDSIQPSQIDQAIEAPIYIDIASSRFLSENNTFYFLYPYNILSIDMTDVSQHIGYEIDAAESTEGLLKIKITNSKLGSYKLNFKTRHAAENLERYANKKFLLDVEGNLYDVNGNICDMVTQKSTITLIKASDDLLADYNEDKSIIDLIIANNMKNAIIVG